jgi:Pyrimidine dimer DNA glycosylase
MNIFFLDYDPRLAAEYMVDRHVVKMILESAQLLSTAHRVIDGDQYEGTSKSGRKAKRWRLYDGREEVMYSATHINHPSAIWCRKSVDNYGWLVDHMYALMEEYTYRYGKIHKIRSSGLAYQLASPPLNLKDLDFTIPPSAMAPEFILSDDPVENYRNYYKNGKSHLHKYTKREIPSWMDYSKEKMP